jgi:hypothetical protein
MTGQKMAIARGIACILEALSRRKTRSKPLDRAIYKIFYHLNRWLALVLPRCEVLEIPFIFQP